MKKILTLSALIASLLTANAQSTANNFPANGNVSLGNGNYLQNGKMFYQGLLNINNGNTRGNIANNLYWDNTNNQWLTGASTSSDFGLIRFEANAQLSFFTCPSSGAPQVFSNTGLEDFRRLTITKDGNVGINVADPGARLEVAGAIRSSGFAYTSGYFEATNVQNGNVYFTTNTISGNGLLKLNKLDGSTSIYLNSSGASYFTGGNLLIGKTSQTNTSYKLDVDGYVRADKVVVNTSGADYVFDSTYNLRSLDEVESFIKSNHHLPEIAPAADMQANGIDIGNNQTKLLQKTEELTLYLIQQNKQLKEQLAINTAQDRRMQELTEQNKQLKDQVSDIEVLKQLIAKQQEAIEALQQKADKANSNKD